MRSYQNASVCIALMHFRRNQVCEFIKDQRFLSYFYTYQIVFKIRIVFSYRKGKEEIMFVFVFVFDLIRKLFYFDTTFIKRIFFVFMLKLFYSFFDLYRQPFFYLFFPVFCFISKFLYSWASSLKDSTSFVHVCSCPRLLFMVGIKRIFIKLVECRY